MHRAEIGLGEVKILIWAGHETTIGQLAWAIIDLLRHPAEMRKVLAEQHEVLPGHGPADMKTVRRLAHLGRSLQETQRLHPAALGMILVIGARLRRVGSLTPPGHPLA